MDDPQRPFGDALPARLNADVQRSFLNSMDLDRDRVRALPHNHIAEPAHALGIGFHSQREQTAPLIDVHEIPHQPDRRRTGRRPIHEGDDSPDDRSQH